MSETAAVTPYEALLQSPPDGETHHIHWEFSEAGISYRSKKFLRNYSPFVDLAIQERDNWKEELQTSSKEQILTNIQTALAEIRNEGASKAKLASKEILPRALGLLSTAVKLTLDYDVRPEQMFAVIALVVGNKKDTRSIFSDLKDIFALATATGKENPRGKGNVAKLRTGEGKTLVAALTAITFSLEGSDKQVFVSSINDLLAAEGFTEMGPLYRALGITTSLIDSQNEEEQYVFEPLARDSRGFPLQNIPRRRQAYDATVVYGTADEFGFDYLRTIRAKNPDMIVQTKDLNVMVPDEFEEIATKDASSPLVMETAIDTPSDPEELKIQPEILDDQTIIDNKPYRSEELHTFMKEIVSFLDPQDVQLNRSSKSVELFDSSGPSSRYGRKKKIPQREAPYISRETQMQVEEKLRKGGILGSDEILENSPRFTPDQRIHLYLAYGSLGIDRVNELMKAFGLLGEENNLYETADTDILLYYLTPALQAASEFLQQGVHFGLSDDQHDPLTLLDPSSGRPLPGRKIVAGGHQALEAFYGQQISPESLTFADTTFQEFFSLFDRIAGLSATADAYAEEESNLYNVDVIDIPPHIKSNRKDLEHDTIHLTQQEKFQAIFDEQIVPFYTGQEVQRPVLVSLHTAASVKAFHAFLLNRLREYNQTHPDSRIAPQKIQFVTWDNRQDAHKKFADMGREGYITITDMANRGVDSQLGGKKPHLESYESQSAFERAFNAWLQDQKDDIALQKLLDNITLGGEMPDERSFSSDDEYQATLADWTLRHGKVNEAGGLHIIGERYSRVADIQAAGRGARNGDEGSVIFYSSLEDQLYMEALGEGRLPRIKRQMVVFGGAPITGKEAKKLLFGTQQVMYTNESSARKELAEMYLPLREATQAYNARRKELLFLGFEETYEALQMPEVPLKNLSETAIAQQVLHWLDQEVTQTVQIYQDKLDKVTYMNDQGAIRQALQDTLNQFAERMSLSSQARQELDDRILRLFRQNNDPEQKNTIYVPPANIQEALLNFFWSHYLRLVGVDLAKVVEEKRLPEFIQRTEAFNSQRVSQGLPPIQIGPQHMMQRELREHQRTLILDIMDQAWQEYREERLFRNKHLRATEKDPLSAMKLEAEKTFQQFKQDVRQKIITGLFSGVTKL